MGKINCNMPCRHWGKVECKVLVQGEGTGKSRSTALLLLNLDTIWGLVVNAMLLYCQQRVLIPIVQEAGWAPGPIWIGVKKSNSPAPPGFKPWAIQPLVSRYTDYVTLAPLFISIQYYTHGTLTILLEWLELIKKFRNNYAFAYGWRHLNVVMQHYNSDFIKSNVKSNLQKHQLL